ncbi:hypothetical protein [Oceanibaculum pacificum]|nr:hypothetical protein [Oceanibaculum pacificum]
MMGQPFLKARAFDRMLMGTGHRHGMCETETCHEKSCCKHQADEAAEVFAQQMASDFHTSNIALAPKNSIACAAVAKMECRDIDVISVADKYTAD